MKYDVIEEILRLTNDEFQHVFKMDISKIFEDNMLLTAEMTKKYALIVSLSTMIVHHNILREKLLHYDIDIGKLPAHF